MTGPGVRPWPAALFGLNLTIAAASVVLSVGREAGYDTVFYSLNAVALGLAGFLIVSYRPGHSIGVLLTALGIEAGLVEVAEGYGYHAWSGAATATWASEWGSFIGIGGTVILPAIFPDGRPPTPRWWPVVGLGVSGAVLAVAGTAFGHGFDADYAGGVNPYAAGGPWPGAALVAGQCALAGAVLGSVAALVVRFRRSSPEQRLQLKWLVSVLALLAVAGPLAIFLYDRSVLVRWLIAVAVLLIPLAVGVGIVRHRLYDIDLLISRTLVYLSVSALLAGGWLGMAWLLGALLGGARPSWVVAAATVTACAAFLPARNRLQDVVDRRFRRSRYDALARVDAHLEDLRHGRAAAEDLELVLGDVLDLPGLRLHFVLPGELVVPASAGVTRTTVRRDGLELAWVEHPGPAPQLLGDVLARAGLAIEIARLRAEVARQLVEVSRSRERVIAAGHEERRRLERDLHDGAQQRLVAVGLTLRHAQHELGPSPVGAGLDDAVREVRAAIEELREIARGVRPSGLDDGLAVALRELAGRTPLPVELDLGLDRCSAEVEATAYFVASEALTNAVKHAEAGSIQLRTHHQGDQLVLRISDDGVGGADPRDGSGLRGLGDRVAAHGGELHLASPSGHGTVLTASLPCGC